ncbi:MAG: hypothetical protein ACI9DF_003160 [Verrucomicrobiales bacterium]|jgi:hypothetical protein
MLETSFSMTLGEWVRDQFTTIEQADPLVSDVQADPDGDRLVNLIEYGLGLTPETYNDAPEGRIGSEAGMDYLALRYTRITSAADLTFIVETGNDLTGWVETTIQIGPIIDHENGTETLVIPDTQPIQTASLERRFMRLRIRQDS